MDSYLPHECLPIAVVEPLSMYLDLRGSWERLATMLERKVEIGFVGTTRCMYEWTTHITTLCAACARTKETDANWLSRKFN
jgi:hypothetical protein